MICKQYSLNFEKMSQDEILLKFQNYFLAYAVKES